MLETFKIAGSKTLTASDISRKAALIVPANGQRCFITVNESCKIEMVCDPVKGAAGGVVWHFVCPKTGKRCKKLHFNGSTYVHTSTIKGYYRSQRPLWYTGTPLDKLLTTKLKATDAEEVINAKGFKSHRSGKPTKRYLKCLKHIQAAEGITQHDIVNGGYDYLLKLKTLKVN